MTTQLLSSNVAGEYNYFCIPLVHAVILKLDSKLQSININTLSKNQNTEEIIQIGYSVLADEANNFIEGDTCIITNLDNQEDALSMIGSAEYENRIGLDISQPECALERHIKITGKIFLDIHNPKTISLQDSRLIPHYHSFLHAIRDAIKNNRVYILDKHTKNAIQKIQTKLVLLANTPLRLTQ